MTDQNLSEAVILLQRQDLAPETRDVVEEAARLLADGREGEARALIEKAEALAVLDTHTEDIAADGEESGQEDGAAASAPPSLQDIVAPLAAKVAEGIAGILTGLLEDLQRYAGDQVQVVAKSLQQHIEELDSALCDIIAVSERLEERANHQQTRLEAAEQSHEALRDVVFAVQETSQQHGEGLDRATSLADELSRRMTDQLDATASRFASLEDRVNLLDQYAQEAPAQLAGIMSRLDGHTETLRSLEEQHTHRVSKLNQVLDSLVRLREPETPELAMQAVA